MVHIQNVVWDGNPNATILRPYINWMNSVNQTLSDKWKMKLMHCYLIKKDLVEIWGFEPGKQPLLLDVVKGIN